MTASSARIGLAGGYGFVVLGLTDSAIGVAWPAIRQTFDEPLSALSLLLFASALGYLPTAGPSGQLLSRFGTAQTLVAASLTAGLRAPSWPRRQRSGYRLLPALWGRRQEPSTLE